MADDPECCDAEFLVIDLLFSGTDYLAIMLNELRLSKVKKIVQTITFLPHFISMVAFVALVTAFLSPSTGTIGSTIGSIMKFFGMEPIWLMGDRSPLECIYGSVDVHQRF